MLTFRHLCFALVVSFLPTVALAKDERLDPPKTSAEIWRAVD